MTASRLHPVRVRIQSCDYLWTPGVGLDPSVIETVEGWIWRRARALARAAAVGGLSLEDLVQEGRLGALKAARTFEPGHGANFLTWAAYAIREAMFDALDQAWEVSVPRAQRRALRAAGQRVQMVSLDAPREGSEPLSAHLPSEPAEGLEGLGSRARQTLHDAILTLKPRYREVILRRFGFFGEAQTFEAIGAALGLTRQRVAQIDHRARLCLRAALAGSAPPTPALLPQSRELPMYPHTLTASDLQRQRTRAARAKANAEREAQKNKRQAALGAPLFHLDAQGCLEERAPCPDCEPAGSGFWRGRTCECCGGTGVVLP